MPPDLRIAFTSLDNAFGAVSDVEAVQRICGGITRLTTRVIIPALAQVADTSPPPDSPRLQGDHRRSRQPRLTPHPATTCHQALLISGTNRDTQPKLT